MINERIRELALEAGLYYHPHGTCCMDEMFPFHFNPAEADKAYGKFAELIIKECARLCNDFDVYYADNSPLKREVALETAHDLADLILEHFEENI